MKISTCQAFNSWSLVPNSRHRRSAARKVIAIVGACLNSILLLVTTVSAEPYDTQLGSKIDTYLSGRGSPIAGNGAEFFSSGVQFDVDPRLIVAIAGAESSFGTHWVNCPQSGFNAWSWFYRIGRPCSQSPFGSFADGIQRVTSGIRRLYLNQGANTIQDLLEHHYCVSRCGNWVPTVTSFYTEQDGDTSDLTFHIGLIDFEQFTTAPSHFTGAQPSLQVFAEINGTVSTKIADSATISRGQLLNLANVPVDPSIVYGTLGAGSLCPGCLRTITIQFANKVSNFSMFLLDSGGPAVVTYMVQDDQGGMKTITSVGNFVVQGYTVMFPEVGIRQVTVTSTGGVDWDFFIDNIRFSPD